MATQHQQPSGKASDGLNPYEALSVPRTATVDEIRRSYKQKVLETHPDKLPPAASEEEKNVAQELFRQVQEAFEILNDPIKRKGYDIHHRPLPRQIPVRTNSKASTLSRTTSVSTLATAKNLSRTTSISSLATAQDFPITTSVSTLPRAADAPPRTPSPPRATELIPASPERPQSGAVIHLEQHRFDEAQTRRMKERSEWARKAEERRLGKLKAYTAAEEIQTLGQKQAALVDKMIQELFALTPEWEIRRMKARAYKASRASARAH